jgi:hypothetical protein
VKSPEFPLPSFGGKFFTSGDCTPSGVQMMADFMKENVTDYEVPYKLHRGNTTFSAENVVDDEKDCGLLATPSRAVKTEAFTSIVFLARPPLGLALANLCGFGKHNRQPGRVPLW